MAKTQSQMNNAFAKKNYRRFELVFHKTYDAELLAYFESISNKQTYIKDLIKNDMDNKKNGGK